MHATYKRDRSILAVVNLLHPKRADDILSYFNNRNANMRPRLHIIQIDSNQF